MANEKQSKTKQTIIEYQTTFAEWYRDRGCGGDDPISYHVPDPIEPDGEGWTMCGSAADDKCLFWFWMRSN